MSARRIWVGTAALAIAVAGARSGAGGWNDGSRLATVESLVDHGTLAIDASVFVAPPPHGEPPHANPYPAGSSAAARGTLDKLRVQGHWYSDKPPTPQVLMAGVYAVWQALTGLRAAAPPLAFGHRMTLASSGVAYVVAVLSVLAFARRILGDTVQTLAVVTSFALGTLALPYTRHVNAHIVQLGLLAPLFLGAHVVAMRGCDGRRLGIVAAMGGLAGISYATEVGSGAVFVLASLGWVAWRVPGALGPAVFVLAAVPGIAFHHALNGYVGGTIWPANTIPEYLGWEESPFDVDRITGRWGHESVWRFAIYGPELLVGKPGFLLHNLPLLLVVAGWASFPRGVLRRLHELPELALAFAMAVGVLAVYWLGSVNYGGGCLSVRWFVPLLAPGFYALAVLLKERPACWRPFVALSRWGVVLGVLMWRVGPWTNHVVPGYWLVVAGTAVHGLVAWRRGWWLVGPNRSLV